VHKKVFNITFLGLTQIIRKVFSMGIDLDKELLEKHFRVTIFGSARIEKGDTIYTPIFELAKMISEEGIDLVTGGGPGLMNAASEGHHTGRKDDKSHSVGLRINLPLNRE
jgi:predicted Rossmann-fold nucleotide-binding protein